MAFTYFYRDVFTLNHAIDMLFKKNKNEYNVWDAGCAMGLEPYTFLLLVLDRYGLQKFNKLTIYATDLDPENDFLSTLKSGIYNKNVLHRVPSNLLQKYFKKINNEEYKIDDLFINKITCEKQNILKDKPSFSNFDLVICKNVLLHFSYKQQIKAMHIFYNCLNTNGIFISEHTQIMPKQVIDKFHKEKQNVQLWLKKCE